MNLTLLQADMEDDSGEEEVYSEEEVDDEDEIVQGIRVCVEDFGESIMSLVFLGLPSWLGRQANPLLALQATRFGS